MSFTATHNKGVEARFRDRLLAEAVRVHEQTAGRAFHDTSADAVAREAGGDLERRVMARAAALPVAAALRAALARLRQASGWAVVIAAAIWGALGAGAARAAMEIGPGEAVNVFAVLVALLGPQSVLLAVWLVAMAVWPRGAGQGSLGAKVMGAAQWVAERVQRGDEPLAAIRATGTAVARSNAAPWLFGGISHAMWLAFNVACLVTLAVMLSVRYYVFAWETTILTPGTYVQATQVLGSMPAWLGMQVPSPEQVRATQVTDTGAADADALAAAREAWAGLLLGAVLAYGLAPRLLLTLACGLLGWRAQRRYRLNLEDDYYRQLASRLMPAVQSLGVVDPADGAAEPPPPAFPEATRATRASGPPAIMALEVGAVEGPWPPAVDAVDWQDLGFVEDREARHRVMEQLEQSDAEPAVVVIVCELASTPDRGTQRYLGEIRQAVTRPPVLLLTGGHALRQRGDAGAVDRRLAQWRAVAAQAGIEGDHVLDLDLDHATEASVQRLAALLPQRDGGDSETPASAARAAAHAAHSARHLDAAFDRIETHCRAWTAPPDAAAQAKLHRDIAALYGAADARGPWSKMLNVPTEFRGDWQSKVRDSASRVVDLLPPSLRLRPRWLAAGAASGALGCVAAAMLLSPLAIAALPTWAAIGAAVAGAMQPRAGQASGAAGEADAADALHSDDYTEAVDAAALFAMLLELQGRGETTISRVLERAIADVDDNRRLTTADDARRWLEALRHRFDMALAAEVQR